MPHSEATPERGSDGRGVAFPHRTIWSRRAALGGLGGLMTALAIPVPGRASEPAKTGLILLGTGGGPVIGAQRSMMASVVVANGVPYLVDCGYGAGGAMVKAGVRIADLGGIFITHNHADHLLDLGPTLFFSWLQGRKAELELFGPPPLKAIVDDLLAANRVPLDYYRVDMGTALMPPVRVKEFSDAGIVFEDANVRVTAVTVVHPPVVPSFAYRFDTADRSIVFSGDTAVSENLVVLAKGADILVHEAAEVQATIDMMSAQASVAAPASADAGNGKGGQNPKGFDPKKFEEHVLKAHTSVQDAARLAAAADVKTLVLSHVSPVSSAMVPDSRWIEDARPFFGGTIVVGHDGLVM